MFPKHKTSPKFDPDFLEIAFDFLNTYYILDIDIDHMFKLSNKEKQVLSKLEKIYSRIKLLKDYKTVQLSHITTEDKEISKLVYSYFYIKSYDYLLSDLYSSILAEYYLLDKETMIKRLKALFNNKITIKDFLDIYNINLLNKDLIPVIKEESNKCKRMVIVP